MRTALAWLLALACAGFALVRVLGLERGYPAVPLIAFTPWSLPLVLVAAGAALALGRRAAAAVALLAAVVLVGLIAPRALGGDTEGGPALRVMTTNVFVARGDPRAVVRVARREDADVVAVQELDRAWARRVDAAGFARRYPYRVLRFGRGTGSTALYSRFPLRALPAPQGTLNPIARGTMTVGGERVEVASVHPPPPVPRWIAVRDRELRRMLAPAPGRILAGDFNATLDHRPFRRLLARGYADAAERTGTGLRPTWPVNRHVPPVVIDHVLGEATMGFRDVVVRDIAGSDHRSVVATVVLAP